MNDWLKCKLEHIHCEFDYLMDAVLFLTTIKEKYVRMYEKFIHELRSYLKAIRILSKGYLPITLIMPSKLELWDSFKQTVPVLQYEVGYIWHWLPKESNYSVPSVHPTILTKLTLYQVETVPVPILDAGNKVQSYTQLKIEKPYIALNDEMYITICPQELNNCKKIGYKYFCEEHFVVKSKHQYSCASAVYFNTIHEIKENCNFYYYHNKINITPSVLDGGKQIISCKLAQL